MDQDTILSLLIFGLIYFLPTIAADVRRHNSRDSIFVINLLLGWTVLFWILSLAWSFSGNTKKAESA